MVIRKLRKIWGKIGEVLKKTGKSEEKLENFEKHWKIWGKIGKFWKKLGDLEKIQKSRENWERTSNETRKFGEKSEKIFGEKKKSPEKWGENYAKIKIQAKMQKKNPKKKSQENSGIFVLDFSFAI